MFLSGCMTILFHGIGITQYFNTVGFGWILLSIFKVPWNKNFQKASGNHIINFHKKLSLWWPTMATSFCVFTCFLFLFFSFFFFFFLCVCFFDVLGFPWQGHYRMFLENDLVFLGKSGPLWLPYMGENHTDLKCDSVTDCFVLGLTDQTNKTNKSCRFIISTLLMKAPICKHLAQSLKQIGRRFGPIAIAMGFLSLYWLCFSFSFFFFRAPMKGQNPSAPWLAATEVHWPHLPV